MQEELKERASLGDISIMQEEEEYALIHKLKDGVISSSVEFRRPQGEKNFLISAHAGAMAIIH
jgi:hypothetical protein